MNHESESLFCHIGGSLPKLNEFITIFIPVHWCDTEWFEVGETGFSCAISKLNISRSRFFLVHHNFLTNSRIETKLRQLLTFSTILPPWKCHLFTSTTQLFTANQSCEANFRIFMWSASIRPLLTLPSGHISLISSHNQTKLLHSANKLEKSLCL